MSGEIEEGMLPKPEGPPIEEVSVDMTGIDIVDIIDRGHAVSVYVKFGGKEFAVNINGKTFNESSEADILRKVKKACESIKADNKPKIDTMISKYKMKKG